MKKRIRIAFWFFRTIKWYLYAGLLLSFAYIGVYDLWLINMPQAFSGAAQIGDIINHLAISYISSFIFYLMVVHLKTFNDRRHTFKLVHDRSMNIVGDAMSIWAAMGKAANLHDMTDLPTGNQLRQACAHINPFSNAPLLLGHLNNYANWLQFFQYHQNRTKNFITTVLQKSQFLEAKTIAAIVLIKDTSFFTFIPQLLAMQNVNMPNLSTIESLLADYFKHAENLSENIQKKIRPYIE